MKLFGGGGGGVISIFKILLNFFSTLTSLLFRTPIKTYKDTILIDFLAVEIWKKVKAKVTCLSFFSNKKSPLNLVCISSKSVFEPILGFKFMGDFFRTKNPP